MQGLALHEPLMEVGALHDDQVRDEARSIAASLNRLRRSGESVAALEVGRRDLYAALSNEYRVVKDSQEGVIFDLDAAPSRMRAEHR